MLRALSMYPFFSSNFEYLIQFLVVGWMQTKRSYIILARFISLHRISKLMYDIHACSPGCHSIHLSNTWRQPEATATNHTIRNIHIFCRSQQQTTLWDSMYIKAFMQHLQKTSQKCQWQYTGSNSHTLTQTEKRT